MALYIGAAGLIIISALIWTLDRCLVLTYGVLVYLIETALFIALIVMYGSLISKIVSADFDLINYVVTNQCSEGPLQHAYEVLFKDLSYDYNVLSTGLFFIVMSFAVHLVIPAYEARRTLCAILCCRRSLYVAAQT